MGELNRPQEATADHRQALEPGGYEGAFDVRPQL